MFWTRSPTNGVIDVEVYSSATLGLIDDLKPIVVDKHIGRPALQFVR